MQYNISTLASTSKNWVSASAAWKSTSIYWYSASVHCDQHPSVRTQHHKNLPLLIGRAAGLKCNNSGGMAIFNSLRRCRQLFIMSVSTAPMLFPVMIKSVRSFYSLNWIRAAISHNFPYQLQAFSAVAVQLRLKGLCHGEKCLDYVLSIYLSTTNAKDIASTECYAICLYINEHSVLVTIHIASMFSNCVLLFLLFLVYSHRKVEFLVND